MQRAINVFSAMTFFPSEEHMLDVAERRTSQPRRLNKYYLRNAKNFLQATTLHGLKFVADANITIWERSFFLLSFIAAVITTAHLIANIYNKWASTPVIIGISPYATSILQIPFPAITVCNMNQAQRSKVANYSECSNEGALLKLLCNVPIESRQEDNKSIFQDNDLDIGEFVLQNSQACSKMLLYCRMSYTVENCSLLFREVLTDEGRCCAFNILHPDFLYKNVKPNATSSASKIRDGRVAVDWNIETGYPPSLPEKYTPQPAAGTGVSMGLTLVLDAELDEYYCSSTNGPGFKISLHNPIDTPHIKETGLLVPLGYETRFRIDAARAEAVPSIRSVNLAGRQCLFNDEKTLLYYKYYTRGNCESECQATFLLKRCQCIPYNLPLIYANASVCNVQMTTCISRAEQAWLGMLDDACKQHCLPSCFDLSYLPDSFAVALARRNYTIPNPLLRRMRKDYMIKNIAVVNFYYRESVFYGDLKNNYIGLTEFLSNTGGIMGLFMGFSFISVAEIFYFALLRPLFDLLMPQRRRAGVDLKAVKVDREPRVTAVNDAYKNWQAGELYKPMDFNRRIERKTYANTFRDGSK